MQMFGTDDMTDDALRVNQEYAEAAANDLVFSPGQRMSMQALGLVALVFASIFTGGLSLLYLGKNATDTSENPGLGYLGSAGFCAVLCVFFTIGAVQAWRKMMDDTQSNDQFPDLELVIDEPGENIAIHREELDLEQERWRPPTGWQNNRSWQQPE